MQKAQPGMSGLPAYSVIKQEMYRETIEYLQNTTEESIRMSVKALEAQRERQERQAAVKAWEATKAKL